jgi:hypothetical protein
MRETVGFRSSVVGLLPEILKQDALIFSQIGLVSCEQAIDTLDEERSTELRWLVEQGILFDLNMTVLNENDSLDNETRSLLYDSWELVKHYEKKIEQDLSNEDRLKLYLTEFSSQELWTDEHREKARLVKELAIAMLPSEMLLRPLATYYRNAKCMDVYPLFVSGFPELTQQNSGLEDVIEIAIKHLPVPDDSTSWEQITDFRNDPDTERRFLNLRNWMNKTARAKLTPPEIEQELEWLLLEYRQHMELHRMKTNASTLETIIVTGAEIAENLVKLQFGKLAKGLFSLRHRKLALLEGELKSPGREIAFISKAQETFR